MTGGTRRVGRRVAIGAGLLGVGAAVSAPWWRGLVDGSRDAVHGELTVATGGSSGVYFHWATALAETVPSRYPNLRLIVEETAGSVDNMHRLGAGSASLAIVALDAAMDQRSGEGASDTPVALARIYDDCLHIIVRHDDPATSVLDLAGRTVAVGQVHSGTAMVADRLFSAIGLRDVHTVNDGLVGSMSALARAEIDAVIWSGGVPTPLIRSVASAGGIRLLSLDAEADRLRARYPSIYRNVTIDETSYGGLPPVGTVRLPNMLLAAPSLSAQVVFALLDTLFHYRDRISDEAEPGRALDIRLAVATRPVPLHLGAVRFYRSRKP